MRSPQDDSLVVVEQEFGNVVQGVALGAVVSAVQLSSAVTTALVLTCRPSASSKQRHTFRSPEMSRSHANCVSLKKDKELRSRWLPPLTISRARN
jgi:hypothetical protein